MNYIIAEINRKKPIFLKHREPDGCCLWTTKKKEAIKYSDKVVWQILRTLRNAGSHVIPIEIKQ